MLFLLFFFLHILEFMWGVFCISLFLLCHPKFVIQESSLCQLSYKLFLLKFGYKIKKLWAFSLPCFLYFFSVFFSFFLSFVLLKNAPSFISRQVPSSDNTWSFHIVLYCRPLSIQHVCNSLFLRTNTAFTFSPPLACWANHLWWAYKKKMKKETPSPYSRV